MTRIKKLLLAGSMAVVTCCVSLSSSILNVSSLFARVRVNADTNNVKESTDPNFNNNHNQSTTQNGKVITVSNIPNSAQKGGEAVYIPSTIMSSTVGTDGKVTGVNTETNPTIIIKNPYGVNLLDENGDPIVHEPENSNPTTPEGEGETESGSSRSDVGSDPIQELVKLDSSDPDHPNTFKFTPAQIGTYTVQYAINTNTSNPEQGVWTTSNVYSINVAAEQFSIEFATNNPIVMPDQIDTNQNLTDEDKSVDIALPLFYDGQGEQIKHLVLETDETNSYYIVADYVTLENIFLDKNNSPVSVSEHPADAEGKNVYEKYSTYQIRKLSKTAFETENVSTTENPNGKYEFSVAINTKVSNKSAMSNSVVLTKENVMTIEQLHSQLDMDKIYNYSDYAYRFVAGNGLNFIDYRLYETNSSGSSSVTMPLSSISKSIDGSHSYNRDNINVGVSVSSNIRSSATSVGKKTYLPTVNTVNKNANRNSIPAYYYYKVAYVDEKNKDTLVYDDSSKVIMGIDDGGIYFIPKVIGKFNIYYNAQDFYYDKVSKKDGHTDAFADDYDYDVSVSDRTSPDVYLVNTYNFDNLDKTKDDEVEGLYGEELKKYLKESDYSYMIPTKYNISTDRSNLTKITIPALFAEDNHKPFNELRIARTITSTNGFKVKDEIQKDFSIRVQNLNSVNETDFSTSLNNSGIFIDDIVKFNFGENLPENYYYAQGKFYDTKNGKEVSEQNIKNNHLAIDEVENRIYVTKEEDGNTVEDTTKRPNGKYYIKEVDGVKKIYETEEAKDLDTIKKLKSSAVAIITIDPNLFSAGEYTIEFKVSDTVTPNNTGDKFTFTLVENTAQEDLDKEAPEVKFTTATTIGNIGKDQQISIAKPRVTDDVDTRILVKYYVEANNKYKEIKLDDNNKLTFKTSDKVDVGGVEKTIYELATEDKDKSLRVVAIAYDDFAGNDMPLTIEQLNDKDIETAINGNAHIGYAIYPISIKYVEDSLAPVIYEKLTFAGDENNFNQGDKVLINGIRYYDNTQNAYLKGIRVVDSNGNVCASQSLTFSDFKDIIDKRVETEGEANRSKIEKEIRNQLLSSINKIETSAIPGDLAVSAVDKDQYIYEYYFPGISFIATEAENYTITYELCDMGTNNITALTFVTSKAADTEAPVISGTTDATNTIELGETYYISDIKVADNSSTDKINLSWEVKGAKTGYKNNWFSKLDNGTFVFNPQAVDVYTITLTAIDERDNASSKSFIVTVKDTSKPTIELNKQYPTGEYGEYAGSKITIDEKDGDPDPDNGIEGGTNKDGIKIKWSENKLPSVNLPGFSAKDKYQEVGYDSLGANGNITIKTPDDVSYVIDSKGNVTGGQNEIKLEMKSHMGVNYFSFTPTKRGHYVATYSAKDLNGNSAEKNEIIDIYVGDTEVPVIYLTKNLMDKLNKGFVVGENNELVINPDARISGQDNYTSQDLYVEDNYGFNVRTSGSDGEKYEYVTVSVSVTNENNSTIKQQDSQGDGKVRYKFDTAGTYTLTLTVTDDCGNTGTFHRTFVVSKDKPSSLDTTKIVGIVLIVVSVLILGGVVIYFVKGTKFLPKRKKNGKGKKDKTETPADKQE